jgi:hypothetical protein
MSRPFRHRIAFGCWINDMRSAAMPNEEWPCTWFDDLIEQDLLKTMRLQAASGFNVFDLFGMFAGYSWPVDIVSCADADRRARARRIIDAAHGLGLKIIHGTGVYSWGFDEIIKADARVRGPNPHALCGSREESWEWMKKVLDFVLENFDLDGFHLEASDQGRCHCPACRRWGDVEYYSLLNARAADYIRSKAPDKLILVNTCGYVPWGDRMPSTEYRHLVELSRHIDVLIDRGTSCQFLTNPDDWPKLIPSLACDFGTSGRFWVYPPQRWERLRWFLPYTQRTAGHLARLSDLGGNAWEYYMGPIVNPGVEVNVAFGGRLLSDASRRPQEVLDEVVDEMYRPRSDAARRDLVRKLPPRRLRPLGPRGVRAESDRPVREPPRAADLPQQVRETGSHGRGRETRLRGEDVGHPEGPAPARRLLPRRRADRTDRDVPPERPGGR